MAGKIIVEVDNEGGTQVSVEGVSGPSCRLLTADVEKALGVVTADKPTADLARTNRTVTNQAKAGQ